MKKVATPLLGLLVVLIVALIGIKSTDDPVPAQNVELTVQSESASKSSEEPLTALENLEAEVKSIYTDDSEQDVDLDTYKDRSKHITDSLKKIKDTKTSDEDEKELKAIEDEWQIIQDMAYVKENMQARYKDGEVVSEDAFPEDFEARLERLKEPKAEFYNAYHDLYQAYQELIEAQHAQDDPEDELAYISERVLGKDGKVNPDVSTADLLAYLNRLELLDDKELTALIQAELERRQQADEKIELKEDADEKEDQKENDNTPESSKSKKEKETSTKAQPKTNSQASSQKNTTAIRSKNQNTTKPNTTQPKPKPQPTPESKPSSQQSTTSKPSESKAPESSKEPESSKAPESSASSEKEPENSKEESTSVESKPKFNGGDDSSDASSSQASDGKLSLRFADDESSSKTSQSNSSES